MNDHISFIGVIVSFFAFPFIFCYPIMLMLYLLNSLSKTIFPGMLIVLTFHVAIFNCYRLFSFITSRVSLASRSSPATSVVVEFRSESHSGCAFWLTAVFMEQRRRTLLRACTGHLTSTLDVVCALPTQPCWWYRPLDVQHSVTVPSQWLRHVRGTACRRLSGMHRR